MIPVSLRLRNFLCYGEGLEPLSFEGIHLACLSGDNGAGKSALLDAITWALWGKARAKGDAGDDLIFLGRTEMEVEFEFDLGEGRYRVLRKRSRRGQYSTPSLEFQSLRDGTWLPMTGNSIQETQGKINALLRIEYDTFINSAFILQGRADEFTVKRPGERKRVLGEVLGLSYYDELAERARDRAREREQERRETEASIKEMDAVLAHKRQYQQELSERQEQLQVVEARVKELDEALQNLRHRRAELDEKARQLSDLERRRQAVEGRLAELQRRKSEHERKIGAYQAVIVQREEIEAGHRSLQEARVEGEEHQRRLAQLRPLEKRQGELQRTVDQARSEIETEKRVCESAIGLLENKLGQVAGWKQELGPLHQRLAELEQKEAERDARRVQVQECQLAAQGLSAENIRLNDEMALLKEKLVLLSKSEATCPLCERELGEHGHETIVAKYQTEGKALADRYRRNAARGKTVGEQVRSLELEIKNLDIAIRQKDGLKHREGALVGAIEEAERSRDEVARQRSKLDTLDGRLANRAYAQVEQKELAAVARQVRDLGYDADAHGEALERLGQLRHFETAKNGLDQALRALPDEQAILQRTEADIAAQGQEQQELAAQITALGIALKDRNSLLQQIAQQEPELSALIIQRKELVEHVGRAKQRLEHCDYLEKQRREKMAALNKAAEERSVYAELADAFGKSGIQAMIIDSATPALEQEANAILSRMSDNRMHLRFETQRQAKSGKGDIETLDIIIHDELGPRDYELYSGGEAFRINFAIRVALSKLLAQRAGARLQTLVVDEGFGTQDGYGRERLVEAINAISADFEKIIVITHIQELKDAFPVRIDVVKGPEGSQFYVS